MWKGAAQNLGCGAAFQLRAVIPTPAVLWAWLCLASLFLLLPDYGCYCSRGESSWLLWIYRSQKAHQDKHMLVEVLQGFAPNGWDHPKQAARRIRGRAKDKSGPGKMLPSFLSSAHNLCAKNQRDFLCGRLIQCCASICSMFFEVNCRDILLWQILPLHIDLQPKQRSSSTESVYKHI